MIHALSKAELRPFLERSRLGMPEDAPITVVITPLSDPNGAFAVQSIAFRQLIDTEVGLSHRVFWTELGDSDIDAALAKLSLSNRVSTLYIFAHGLKSGHIRFGDGERGVLYPEDIAASGLDRYLESRVHLYLISCNAGFLAPDFQSKLPEALIWGVKEDISLPGFFLMPTSNPSLIVSVTESGMPVLRPVYPFGKEQGPSLAEKPIRMESNLAMNLMNFFSPGLPINEDTCAELRLYAKMGDVFAQAFLARWEKILGNDDESVHWAMASYMGGGSPYPLILVLLAKNEKDKAKEHMLNLLERGEIDRYIELSNAYDCGLSMDELFLSAKKGNPFSTQIYLDTLANSPGMEFDQTEIAELLMTFLKGTYFLSYSTFSTIISRTNLTAYTERLTTLSLTKSQARMALYFHYILKGDSENTALLTEKALAMKDAWIFHHAGLFQFHKNEIETAAVCFGSSYNSMVESKTALHTLIATGHPEVFYQLYINERTIQFLHMAVLLGHETAIRIFETLSSERTPLEQAIYLWHRDQKSATDILMQLALSGSEGELTFFLQHFPMNHFLLQAKAHLQIAQSHLQDGYLTLATAARE